MKLPEQAEQEETLEAQEQELSPAAPAEGRTRSLEIRPNPDGDGAVAVLFVNGEEVETSVVFGTVDEAFERAKIFADHEPDEVKIKKVKKA